MSPPEPPDRARWARVTDLFHRAADLPVEARAPWLAAACSGDRELLRDITSLLEAHERAEKFIEEPAASQASQLSARISDAALLAKPGQMIGPYRVRGVLGEGGMGVVYLAEDVRLGRDVALKAVTPGSADDGTRIERLRREARAAAAFTHPGVATVYALEEIDRQWFIASEYVPGETLRDELARGPLAVDVAIDTAAAIARALAAAHARGIVHRDLKPENVVRSPGGAVKVLDFGLASFSDGPLAGANLTADGAVLGTPAYMSPEQVRGGRLDGRSDLFALGVLLYEAVAGAHPFAGATPAATLARILEHEPAPLERAAPGGAVGDGDGRAALARLSLVVTRALRKAPDERFQAAAEMADALEAARPGSAPGSGVGVRLRAPAPGLAAGATTSGADGIAAPPPAAPARPGAAVWWWQFHQAAAAVGYALLLIPLWRVRDMASGGLGTGLFLVGLVAAVIAGTLRLHLWFALRQYPDQWADQHAQARRWVRAADVLFTLVLLAEGLTALRVDDPSAILLVAAAAATAVSFVVIEPATTRAALGDGEKVVG